MIREGQKFGKLTALRAAGVEVSDFYRTRIIWKFKCECGREKDLPTSQVTSLRNPVKTCGCSGLGRKSKISSDPLEEELRILMQEMED